MPESTAAPGRCEYEHVGPDFDGTITGFPCGDTATRKLTINDEQADAYIDGMGGWDAYRTDVLSYTTEVLGDPLDIGPDPGRDLWGHDVTYLCDEHADEMGDSLTNPEYAREGVTLLSDTTL